MVELKPETPFAGLLPIAQGAARLDEIDLGHLTSLAPFKGQQNALSKALKKAHGVVYPEPNTTDATETARALWFGRDMALLAGPIADAGLRTHAALTDQTDAWAAARLSGPASEDVLARVSPVDLRAARFAEGATVRTLINHMNGSITRTGSDAFFILVFRSMAQTLVQELTEAMEAVAARG